MEAQEAGHEKQDTRSRTQAVHGTLAIVRCREDTTQGKACVIPCDEYSALFCRGNQQVATATPA